MPTISEVARELGVTRDQIHYMIKREVIRRPDTVGNRFTLSPQDVDTLRGKLRNKTPLTGALVMAQVRGNHLKEAVEQIFDQTQEMVWCAGAWGEHSLLAFLEVPKFDTVGTILFDIQRLGYVNYTRTFLIPPGQYYVKDTIPPGCDRLALVLLNVEHAHTLVPLMRTKLAEMPQVIRYGTILGPWDIFAEVRYRDADHLYSLVMEQLHGVNGVTDTTSILTMPKGKGLRREKDSLMQTQQAEDNQAAGHASEHPDATPALGH